MHPFHKFFDVSLQHLPIYTVVISFHKDPYTIFSLTWSADTSSNPITLSKLSSSA